MGSSISSQKVLRTGDLILDTETNKEGRIHFLVDENGSDLFEAEVSKIVSIKFDDGENIKRIPICRATLSKRRKR